jgi:FkbM family methyltransferase
VRSTALLRLLETGARSLRRVGLGALVDRVAPALGGAVARTTVDVRGLRLAGSHVGHLYYLRELADEGRDRFLVDVMCACIPPGSVAVDGGAHIGYLTLELARAVGEQGHVWAFEPDPGVASALAANIARNGLGSRVSVVPKALGSSPTGAVLHLSGGGETSSLVGPVTSRGSVPVEVVALDDELPDISPDMIKLDLEGWEVEALGGMRRTLDRAGDAVTVVVECNPEALVRAGSSAGELLSLVRVAGFEPWMVLEEERRLVAAGRIDGPGYVNLVCARPGARGRLASFLPGPA